jgi:4-hydroxy-tetrahydrodipicolinate reductase
MAKSFVSIGLGSMGIAAAQCLIDHGWEARGAASHQVGEDLGTVLGRPINGIRVAGQTQDVVDAGADLCVIATRSAVSDISEDIMLAVSAKMNVLSSSEELVYPWPTAPALAKKLDDAAKSAGVSILGAGINPGFAMDMLPILLTSVCRSVRAVEVHRANDLSPYGPSVLQSFGVGLTVQEFESAWDAQQIAGHVGFAQSIMMMSDTLNLGVNRIEETMSPLLARSDRRGQDWVVSSGCVAGIRQEARGYHDDELVVRLVHPQQVEPQADGEETQDVVRIFGDPDIELLIKPEIPGGIGTVALMANSAAPLLAAAPGLLSSVDLPVIHSSNSGPRHPHGESASVHIQPLKYVPDVDTKQTTLKGESK